MADLEDKRPRTSLASVSSSVEWGCQYPFLFFLPGGDRPEPQNGGPRATECQSLPSRWPRPLSSW